MKHTKYTYDKADVLILLQTPFFKRMFYGFRRFIRRTFSGQYEGIFNYLELVWYNICHKNEWETTRVDLLKQNYGQILHTFNTADDAYDWFIKNCEKPVSRESRS